MAMNKTTCAVAALAAILIPAASLAHHQWLLPSATVLSASDAWVTVDAAIANELFYFDHFPMRLTNLSITAPDGSSVEAESLSTGRYRSTFDVHLTQAGTYRIASLSRMMFASWEENGERKMWRGTEEDFEKEGPKDVAGLEKMRSSSRVEVFVTAGSPTKIEPAGSGLEMLPITHPNDLVNGETAELQMLIDGKPAKGLEVAIIPGGIRYRDQLNQIDVTTDDDGKFSVTFPEPGMYWIGASTGGQRRGPGGPGGPGGGPGGLRMPSGDRMSYSATLEVLPQ
jgi:uncharacterized GH25 family protein